MTFAQFPAERAIFIRTVLIACGAHLLLLCTPPLLCVGGLAVSTQPRMAIFLLLATGWLLLEAAVAAPFTQLPLGDARARRLPLAIGLALLATFWAGLCEAALNPVASLDWPALAGGLCMAAGAVLRAVSIRTLGPYFLNEVALLPEQPLVTRGVYGWLRHPSELGSLSLAAGGALLLGSIWAAISAGLFLLPLVVWRVRQEDCLLASRHPLAFAEYARRTSAFLPIWRSRLRKSRILP